jgi:hypothetical protein
MKQEDYGVFALELPGASDTFDLPAERYCWPSNSVLSPHMRKLIELAASTGIDMTKPNNDEPVYNHVVDKVAEVSPALPVSSVSQVESPHQLMVRCAANELKIKSESEVLKEFGPTVFEEARELAKTQKPTRRQVMARHSREEKQHLRQFWRDLRDAGVEICQHSVSDFVHVILTQLDSLGKGENLSVERVLNLAFPDDEKKARSIGNSTRRKRLKDAYKSDAVMNHTVQQAMLETHGVRQMQLRLSARTFRNSLGVNATLYRDSARITKLGEDVRRLTERVEILERQMQSTKQREALDDAGCNSSREKVLALRAEGVGPTAIASALDMSVNTVKSIIRRSR